MVFWWIWMICMLLILVPSVSYGWGYRGWGPPYPSYYQRRRAQQAGLGGGTSFNHQSWGWYGDFVWVMFFMVIFWSFTISWWR